MTTDTAPNERSISSPEWWTDRRTKSAGVGGIVGGVGLLALSFGRTGGGFELGAVGTLYPVGYVLLAVALLAANARYGCDYGRRGRTVATVFLVSLSSYAASIIIVLASRVVFGSPFVPVGVLIGIAYVATRLFGSLYGVVLWRRTAVNGLTAALFVSIVPAIFLLGPLAAVGYPGVWVESPLYLASIALGYELLTAERETVEDGGQAGTHVR
ncbi:hypothetical protein [Haladaptatus sp. CMAA 1911]|uniref:hypothetical protein n=1 Tax=unclassified Haladaptatus TaxID=2622732 RepID=UPI0037541C8E